jgi:hypothetical protein
MATVADLEPAPVRCAGCGERLTDRLGELVVVHARGRAGHVKRVVAREVEIRRPCGGTWRSAAAQYPAGRNKGVGARPGDRR